MKAISRFSSSGILFLVTVCWVQSEPEKAGKEPTGFYQNLLAGTLQSTASSYAIADDEQKEVIEMLTYQLIRTYWVGTIKLGAERNRNCEEAMGHLLRMLDKSERFWNEVRRPLVIYGEDGKGSGIKVTVTPFDQRDKPYTLTFDSIENFEKQNKEFIAFLDQIRSRNPKAEQAAPRNR